MQKKRGRNTILKPAIIAVKVKACDVATDSVEKKTGCVKCEGVFEVEMAKDANPVSAP